MKLGLVVIIAAFALASGVYGLNKTPLKGATDVQSFFAEVTFY